MKFGLCCIALELEHLGVPKKFKKITYKRFSELPREEAIRTLSERILNNIDVTYHAIKYCFDNNYCYRLSSDLFPLLTYDKAEINLEDLPDYQAIQNLFSQIKEFITNNDIRVSCHPSEFNVLASNNTVAVDKTIKELNFYSDFMDKIGCPANHDSPMNLHVHNKEGSNEEIIDRFLSNFDKLNKNCKSRITIENDDKINCWSVKELTEEFHTKTKIPICFDYLHHKCHPAGIVERQAIEMCYETWGQHKPLFHYSESRDEKNIRAHADYPSCKPETYGLDFDLDFEFKMKNKAISHYLEHLN